MKGEAAKGPALGMATILVGTVGLTLIGLRGARLVVVALARVLHGSARVESEKNRLDGGKGL